MALTGKQREILADKLVDLANLVVAGLVIGQVAWNKPFNIALTAVGCLIGALFYLVGVVIR
jgi:CHASE2 domain-containing sensor protein